MEQASRRWKPRSEGRFVVTQFLLDFVVNFQVPVQSGQVTLIDYPWDAITKALAGRYCLAVGDLAK